MVQYINKYLHLPAFIFPLLTDKHLSGSLWPYQKQHL